ncbi:YceI family protein [Aquimarina sp. AU474]|uniref:YceI family protein n=1 Tax=Aquimarina sp. AU474 TaxID=2108529 RepID=UPI000D68BDB5|nr:YceI family protein [Aquimarina sp. AU474]
MKSIQNALVSTGKMSFVFLTLLLTSLPIVAQENSWKIDPNHSTIDFEISYFKIGEIKGSFENYSGSFIEKDGVISEVSITINTASINTNQADRDKHLKSKDFFNTDEYSEIQFKSTNITKTSTNVYEAKGQFTMGGITKTISLKLLDKGSYVHPRFKTTNKFISVIGIILREDFEIGTNYAPAKFALGKEVDLISEIHIVKEK